MERLETHGGSSATLARGLELCGQPLDAVLNVKEEDDEAEAAMRCEIQAGFQSLGSLGNVGFCGSCILLIQGI